MMTEKPTPQKEVAVNFSDALAKVIRFYGSKDAINDFESFGDIFHQKGDQYSLVVDSRFDFNEVLEYINNYG